MFGKVIARALPLAVGAVLSFAASSSANAAIVNIAVTSGGAPGAPLVSGVGTVGNIGVFGSWTVEASGQSQPVTSNLLSGQTIDASTTGAGTLAVWISATGLTGPAGPAGFLSGFTENLGSTPGVVTIQEFSYFNADNAVFGTATPLSNATFSNLGVSSGEANGVIGAGPYSIVTEYLLTATGAASANASVVVQSVPEASTWAMMVLGFLGIGFLAYRKKPGVSNLRIA